LTNKNSGITKRVNAWYSRTNNFIKINGISKLETGSAKVTVDFSEKTGEKSLNYIVSENIFSTKN